MKNQYNYVKSIINGEIKIHCICKTKQNNIKSIGAKKKLFRSALWTLKYTKNDEVQLAKILEQLRDFGFYFAGAAGGWPPSAIFDYLREKKLTHGKIFEIMWKSPCKAIILTR